MRTASETVVVPLWIRYERGTFLIVKGAQRLVSPPTDVPEARNEVKCGDVATPRIFYLQLA